MKIKACWVKTKAKGNGLKNLSQIKALRVGKGFLGYSKMDITKIRVRE